MFIFPADSMVVDDLNQVRGARSRSTVCHRGLATLTRSKERHHSAVLSRGRHLRLKSTRSNCLVSTTPTKLIYLCCMPSSEIMGRSGNYCTGVDKMPITRLNPRGRHDPVHVNRNRPGSHS